MNMKINYSPNNGDLTPNKNQKQSCPTDGDVSFTDALNKVCNNKQVDSDAAFLSGLSANFVERLAYYERNATTEEHSTYVEMMKYYAEEER